MPTCVVPGCKSRDKPGQKLSFHQFPSDEQRRNEWLKAISRKGDKNGSVFSPSQYSVVCALHFSDECYKLTNKRKVLKQKAVPSIFPSYPSYMLPKETTPKREIKKFALDVDNCPVAVKVEDTTKEQSCDEIQVLGKVSHCQTPLEPGYPCIKSLSPLKIKCLLVNKKLYNKASLLSNDCSVDVKAKDTAKKQSYDEFQVLGGVSHCQTPLEPRYPCIESLSPLKIKCLLVNKKLLNKDSLLSNDRSVDVDDPPVAVKAKDTSKEQSCDEIQVLGEVSHFQTPLEPGYPCIKSVRSLKERCLLVNKKLRDKDSHFSNDHPVAVKAKDTAKEQSCDEFQVLGEVSHCQTPLESEYSCIESLSPMKKRYLLVNKKLCNKTSRLSNDHPVDVNDRPVAVKAKGTAKEQSCDEFQVLGEVSHCQTPLEPEYPCIESLSPLEKKCLLVNKKLRNKTSLLSKAKNKLSASVIKYDSLLKSYKNLRNEYESLNLDKLNEMDSDNLKRQFLLDQLSALSKKKPKWSESTIRVCMMWHNESPAGYRFARNLGFLKLPSESTLYKINKEIKP